MKDFLEFSKIPREENAHYFGETIEFSHCRKDGTLKQEKTHFTSLPIFSKFKACNKTERKREVDSNLF